MPHLILEHSLQELCKNIVLFKIYAKALYCHLQRVLIEVINSDHYAFLPLRYILDNVLLTRETIDKVRCSKQDSIFLKLEFAKAYHRVRLGISILTHEEDGVATEFFDTVKLLFQDVESCHSP